MSSTKSILCGALLVLGAACHDDRREGTGNTGAMHQEGFTGDRAQQIGTKPVFPDRTGGAAGSSAGSNAGAACCGSGSGAAGSAGNGSGSGSSGGDRSGSARQP